nr:MAG TPA: hypothetical protein [Caudoviricetes sp.]
MRRTDNEDRFLSRRPECLPNAIAIKVRKRRWPNESVF